MPRPISDGTVPWPEEFVTRYVERGYWQGRPLGALLREVGDPDAIALVDGDLRLTYAELRARADGAAGRLAALGLRGGDRILVQLPNIWEFVVLTLGCLRLGVVPVMALPAHRRHELAYLAEHGEVRAIAVPDRLRGFDHRALAHEVAAEAGTVEHVLVAGDAGTDVDLRTLCQPGPAPDAPEPGSRDVAVFLLSGGTTGLPKLIARTHDDYAYNATRSAEVCGFDASTVYLGTLPASHNFPLACPGLLGTLLTGGRVVLLGSPDPAKVLPTIETERITHVCAVPTTAQRWIAAHDGSDDLSSLQVLQVGGARMPPEHARRVRPALGATLQQVFGMAEGLLNYTRLDDPEGVICETQGRPMCPDDEIRIVDESGADVPDGEPGLLLTRGPYTPRGYYRAAEHNARAFTPEGWYRTGDIVRLHPSGNLLVEGRDKDMINRAGEKISAEEVENLAYRVPGVSEVAAVAMPDPELGERICLFVVGSATLDEVRDAMGRAGAARYKLPERLEHVPELPSTNVGKIDKKALRERLVGGVPR
ncbi:MAG: AMP-binding protein [Pseudonocardiaceae bacterium]|nr:AMP-binding protein [Pseudonocardiaceae bacterium]